MAFWERTALIFTELRNHKRHKMFIELLALVQKQTLLKALVQKYHEALFGIHFFRQQVFFFH
jgi:hypothetical protein